MSQVCSIFSQLLKLFPRAEFEQAVRQHRGERHARGFTCWGQFVAMLFCQLGRSLREICGGLAASQGKLRHLGLSAAPPRSTLAYANRQRPWQIYETVFQQLLAKCRGAAPGHKFRFKNKLLSLDASVIDLCASLFDWAQFRRTKGAVKLHLVLDHDGYLPSFCVVTDGKTPDLAPARQMLFDPGTIVVFDRGYNDYDWFAELSERGVFFVTRLKRGADYEVLEQRPLPRRPAGVRRDEVIFFPSLAASGSEVVFRRIEYYRRAAAYAGVFDQSPGAGGCDDRRHLSRPLADRAVFQGPQAEPASEDLRGHLGERAEDPDLDGADRDFAAALPQAAGALGLELVQSGRFVAAAVVCAPRIVRLAGRTVPPAAGQRTRAAAAIITDGNGGLIGTAA